MTDRPTNGGPTDASKINNNDDDGDDDDGDDDDGDEDDDDDNDDDYDIGKIPNPLLEMPQWNKSFLYFQWPEIPDICDESVTIISFAYCGFEIFPLLSII